MKHTDILNTHQNAEEQANSTSSKQITSNEQHGETAFWIRGSDELGYFISIGDRRITELSTKIYWREVLNELREPLWQVILYAITAITETIITEVHKEEAKELRNMMNKIAEADNQAKQQNKKADHS